MGARPSSFARETVVETIPETIQGVTPTREWSEQQRFIFDWFENRHGYIAKPNLVVRARAGTGKTTTIIEGVNRAPEQAILVCAFNKKIAEELKSRINNPGIDVKTLHSLGYAMIRRQWRNMPVASQNVRADSLAEQAVASFEREHGEKVPRQILKLVSLLHTKAREMVPLDPTHDDLTSLAFRFDYVPDDGWGKYDIEFVVAHALEAMRIAASTAPTYDVGIDYADMIYLPLAWKLTARDYQLVVVDEAQDMTVAQLEIATRSCDGRICVVGDDRQSCYSFRGADSGALDRLKSELGAAELPLTVTYRCGQSIVKNAQRLVPDIVAHASNPEGQIIHEATYRSLFEEVKPGDFVLSRLNAPLVSVVMTLLQKGVRAKMAGRDIGGGLLKVLKRLRCVDNTPIEDLISRVNDWERKQVTKLAAYGQDDQIARVRDQAGVLYALSEDCEHTRDLLANCERLFTDDDNEQGQVLCSSIHKAKGLERDRVWVLMESLYRRGISDEEANLEYVAVTRAKSGLRLVYGVPSLATKPHR